MQFDQPVESVWRAPDGTIYLIHPDAYPEERDAGPAGSIELVIPEPVDKQGHTPSYVRGFADGRMASRVALKGAGLTEAEVFALETYFADAEHPHPFDALSADLLAVLNLDTTAAMPVGHIARVREWLMSTPLRDLAGEQL